ncbi:anti-anti-sigma factor [Mycobacterium kyorinense]|uniref:Anti-sigma factor antagonist n=1 Tax=Mycobacterium kyorinense TaxID=487514 RepID=A0A1A2ZB38_9MYCO|nr:STAS domain-containing protein [Mycobacterium kyorinense]OBI47440.1 anti-anti-sigma factor [Mycobacterium kyorinense]
MELLVVECENLPQAVVVRVAGEVDSGNGDELAAHLSAALANAAIHPARLLVVELHALAYFGSAGLNAVLDCHKQGVDSGVAVRLVADKGLVVRTIEVTNMDRVLKLYPTLSDALQRGASEAAP